MGRKKIDLKRIKDAKERSSKYSKRKKGLLKKAKEIALLCDVDMALLLFSPTEKPTLFQPNSRPLSSILEKLSRMSLQEQEERRAYTKKTLMKLYNNNTKSSSENDHFSPERIEVLQDNGKMLSQLREVKELLDEKKAILRIWLNPNEVNDLGRLQIMERFIISSLYQTKEALKNQRQED